MTEHATFIPFPSTSAALRREMGLRAIPGDGPTRFADATPDAAGPRSVILAGALQVAPGLGRRPQVTLYCLEPDPRPAHGLKAEPDLRSVAQQFAGLDLRVMWLTRAACDDLLARFAEFRGLIFRATSAHLAALVSAALSHSDTKGTLR